MPSPHILLVEDNPGDVLLFRKAMRREGVNVSLDVAIDGVDALAFLQRPDTLPPELVILDLNLPRIPGLEVLRQIRRDARLAHIPVAIFSSSTSEHDLRAARALQVDAYLIKPSSIGELQKTIRDLCTHWPNLSTLRSLA